MTYTQPAYFDLLNCDGKWIYLYRPRTKQEVAAVRISISSNESLPLTKNTPFKEI
jgi:hypothetical protein